MSKVFRYHQGIDTISGWGISTKYNNKIYGHDKGAIEDPAGATASKEITSIPSPFARMDLVKAAFDYVNNAGLDGKTIHHKMVSHALDVAQMFFNYDTLHSAKLLELIKWDRTNVQNMMLSMDRKQKLFGRTLDLFFDQDAKTYNFDKLQSIYMLRYVGPGSSKQFNVIGATSPSTLFFTSANDNSCVAKNINFGTHGALDPNTFVKLSQRDENFIKYIYDLRASIDNFSLLFPEVEDYLNKTYAELPLNLQQYVNNINAGTKIIANYAEMEYAPGVPVEVLGNPLGKLRPLILGEISDFAIKSSRSFEKIPLALPCSAFSRQWRYTTSMWNSNIHVPVSDPRDISQRTLPTDNTQWPYLTMDDFLENNIIEMDSESMPDDFFYGNVKDETGLSHCFLLPIKPEYFNYFGIADLKKNLTMECTNASGVGMRIKVTLNVPVKAGIITYERNYYVKSSDGEMMNPKDGAIIQFSFTMTMFPCVKFPNNAKPDYRISLLTLYDDYRMNVTCLKEDNTPVTYATVSDRNQNATGGRIDSNYPVQPMYAVEETFDFVSLSINNFRGIAIPEWRGNAGSSVFEFAVDFGTTNTHIEYRVDNGPSKTLDITGDNVQIANLNNDAVNDVFILTSVRNNQVPSVLGDEIKFPMRTLLSYKKATDWNQPFWPYITGNMPYYYGSVVKNSFNDIESDLKWSSPEQMIKCYLGSLMMLIRNKVLMEGGNLPATRIVWFYPTSMAMNKLTIISGIWESLYNEYIGPDSGNLLISIPESIAPYTYYKNKFGGGVNVLTIDIGGGTTDAYIVDSNAKPAYITSFRFAANSLFGDAFKKAGAETNGFVQKFKPMMEQILNANSLTVVTSVLEDIEKTQISSDYISLLFTLKENRDVINKKCQDNVDFMKMLKKEEGAKTLMLIFYSAIIYHMATFIKAKMVGTDVREPEYIAFSGNGSKLLSMLGVETNVGRQMLSDYTKLLFEKVLGKKYPDYGIKIVTDADKPKEATSKGGLLLKNIPSPMDIRRMSATLLGTSETRFIDGEQYSDLTSKDWNDVKNVIEDFTNKFFELSKEMNVNDAFGAMPYSDIVKYRKDFTVNVENRIKNALNFYEKLNSDTPVENTLFFYPITQLLNELAPKIL